MTVETSVEWVFGADPPTTAKYVETPKGWSVERIQGWLTDDTKIKNKEPLQTISDLLESGVEVAVRPAHRERANYRREQGRRWQRDPELAVWGVLRRAT